MAGAGTQKVYEDERVVVCHFDLEPGQQGDMHTHKLDYVVRVLSGATLEVDGPDGELLYTVDREPGKPVNYRMDGDQIISDRPGDRPAPVTHRARNVGTTTFREVLIEFKDG